MSLFFSRRRLRPSEDDESGELNIIPYLDILMNLIMFMLLSITGLATFGALNVNAPAYGGPAATANDSDEKPKLLLSVLISKKGFFVAGAGAVLGQQTSGAAQPQATTDGTPTVPRKGDGSYDFDALTGQMVQIKKSFPNETKVIVGAEGDVAYDILIQTMDAIRETPGKDRKILFSDVTLAAM